jgi:hypothetical protein
LARGSDRASRYSQQVEGIATSNVLNVDRAGSGAVARGNCLDFASSSDRLNKYDFGHMNQMSTITLVVDKRELSTIRAALLLLQEQIDALPEDLAEMMCEHGPPMSATEIDNLISRVGKGQEEPLRLEMRAEVERFQSRFRREAKAT